MLTRWKMLVLLCGGFVAGTGAIRHPKTVQLGCIWSFQPLRPVRGRRFRKFGDVLTTKVGDASQAKEPVNCSLNCDVEASDYPELQIPGTTTTISGGRFCKLRFRG